MSECPACHTDDQFVYIGVIHVECPNENCVHFTKKAATLKLTSTEVPKVSEATGFDPTDFLSVYDYDTEFD